MPFSDASIEFSSNGPLEGNTWEKKEIVYVVLSAPILIATAPFWLPSIYFRLQNDINRSKPYLNEVIKQIKNNSPLLQEINLRHVDFLWCRKIIVRRWFGLHFCVINFSLTHCFLCAWYTVSM